ncbi:MAG: hypothetical protein JO358_02660 [Alphaproteobacteria bacterium]|nr:hypothetical protein [Alphaproteobacteria bacterium]
MPRSFRMPLLADVPPGDGFAEVELPGDAPTDEFDGIPALYPTLGPSAGVEE